jgi:thioredoxin 1
MYLALNQENTDRYRGALPPTKGNTMSDKILKFSASWCGPCKALSKTLHDQDLGVPVEEVDIDEKSELAVQYGIRSVPTLVYVRGGTEAARLGGAQTLAKVKEWVAGV